MTITNAERDRQRTHPQYAKLYLSVLVPHQVYCGTVNGAHNRGARDITVTNVSGAIANIIEGQTILVGTGCGNASISRRRFKSRAGQVLTLDENSVAWSAGDFITVLENWELWPVFPRFTVTPEVFYKDYDVTYTDENLEPPPVAIAGPHLVGFLDGGTIVFDIDASDSYAVADGASISTYAWSVTGGGATSIANANIATTTLTCTVADTYWLTLVVTDDNGKTQTTRRAVFVHDAANMPYTEFEFDGALVGDWNAGGWELRIVVRGDATASEFPDGTLVILWQESWYGGTQDEINGNVLFAGYIRRDSTTVDWNTGYVSFEATTIDSLLRQCMMFSISLQCPTDNDNKVLARDPEEWYEFDHDNLTVTTAIHHLWRWHSTLFGVADVFLPISNILLMYACDDFEEGNLYTQADNFAHLYGIFAHVCCNKQGQIHVEEDINMLDDVGRAAVATVWNGGVQEEDRREEIELIRRQENEAALIHLSGFSFDGATSEAIVSKAPGDAPEAKGVTKGFERQILEDQAQANELAGRALAVANDGFQEVRMKFAGHYGGAFDIIPQEWSELTLASGDTPRGIVWNSQKLVCRNVQISISANTLLTDCVLVREASGEDGITGDYPTDPPDDDDNGNGNGGGPGPLPASTGALIAFDEDEGCWYRAPHADDWVERDAGLPAGAVDNDNQGGWDPWWFTSEKQNTSDPAFVILFRCQDAHIYRSVDCGVTWSEVTPVDDPPNSWGDAPAPTVSDVTYIQRVDNIHVNKQHIFLVGWQNPASRWRGWLLKTTDDGVTWSWTTLHVDAHLVIAADSDTIVDEAGIDKRAEFVSKVELTPDGTYYVIRETNTNDAVTITFPFTIPVGTNLYIYSKESPRALNHGRAYAWNYGTSTWDQVPQNYGGGAWSWQSGATPVASNKFKLLYKYQIAIGDNWWIDALYFDYLPTFQTKPLWADVDTEDGSILLLTLWKNVLDGTGSMMLQKRLTVDLSFVQSWGMGSDISAAEIAAKTYIAYPHTPLGDKDLWFIFGRLERLPDEEGTTVRHIVKTTDGGTMWANVEDGWGSRHCSAFKVGTDDGAGNRTYTAIKSAGTSSPAYLYRGTNGVPAAPTSTVPFGDGGGVLVDALTVIRRLSGVDILESVACGCDAPGTPMVVFTDDPFTTWIDITNSYPITGVVRSLAYI